MRRLFGRKPSDPPGTPASAGESRAAALVQEGLDAETAGRPADAIRSYRKAIEAEPGFAPAYLNLGIALQGSGGLQESIDAFKTAIAADPGNAAAHFNLAMSHVLQGEFAQSEPAFRAALALRVEFPEAWVGLAESLEALGRETEALAALDRAIALREDYFGAILNAAALARRMGLPADAETRYRRALMLAPESAEVRASLAWVLHAVGRTKDAVQVLFDALQDRPEDGQLREALATVLVGVRVGGLTGQQRTVLLGMCADQRISMPALSETILALLGQAASFAELHAAAGQGVALFDFSDPAVEAFFREPLLLVSLPRMNINDVAMEKILTHARRSILMHSDRGETLEGGRGNASAALVCALARQCFQSGYAFFATADELAKLQTLREHAERKLTNAPDDPRQIEALLSVVALYGPLHRLKGSTVLLELPRLAWSEDFRPLVEEQLANRKREQEIRAQLPAITRIDDQTSAAVREQYEESPYPVWSDAQRVDRGTFAALSRRLRPGEEVAAVANPLPILVAGCGTGRQPIQVAMAHPESEVLAVDLSLTSLAYAARMAERLGVTNVSFRQADILRLGTLQRRFALIECGGVLHHLEDPMRGWQVLVDLLEPRGLMLVGLYSETARRGIEAAREFVRSSALPATPEGIRQARRALIDLAEGDPARDVLRVGDFYSLNGCRDLIMHVKEHLFTVPQIAESLERLDLRLLGFQCDAGTQRRFTEMFPRPGAALDLQAWEKFEQIHPHTFIGMYAFWCCRKAPANAPGA